MQFFLNCWVPSLKRYEKISELKMSQVEVLAKYIANDDNNGINEIFNCIIEKNLYNKKIFNLLTRIDKWFILTFLRASSVSPNLYFKLGEDESSVEYSLINILTEFSELKLQPIEYLKVDDISILLSPSKNLLNNTLLDGIFSLTINDITHFIEELTEEEKKTILLPVKNKLGKQILDHINNYENNYKDLFLLKSNSSIKGFKSIKFKIFDNTLFVFLKTIFTPISQNIYNKKFKLLKSLNITMSEILNLTPAECDLFAGLIDTDNKPIKRN